MRKKRSPSGRRIVNKKMETMSVISAETADPYCS